MRGSWRIFFAGWAGVAALHAGGAALPALDAGLAGEVRIDAKELGRDLELALPANALEQLGLTWTVTLAEGGLRAEARATGIDLALRARPEAGGGWGWRIERGGLDVTELWAMARKFLGEDFAQWSASGRLELRGEGRWQAATGLSGKIGASLREGWAGETREGGAQVSGVELDLETMDLAAFTFANGQSIRVGAVKIAGLELRDARLSFGMDAKHVVRVAGGEAALMGGRFRLKPFSVSLDNPKAVVGLEVESLQIGEVANLMPWIFQMARGRLRGSMELALDAKGLRLKDGGLDVVREDEATFHLSPVDGLLTGSMEPRFRLLPWKWARWVTMNNPAYAPLKAIESGREGLRIETFRVSFWPDGIGTGRPATIHIVGKPQSGALVEEVVLDVNFHGLLTEALNFGLNQDFAGFEFKLQ